MAGSDSMFAARGHMRLMQPAGERQVKPHQQNFRIEYRNSIMAKMANNAGFGGAAAVLAAPPLSRDSSVPPPRNLLCPVVAAASHERRRAARWTATSSVGSPTNFLRAGDGYASTPRGGHVYASTPRGTSVIKFDGFNAMQRAKDPANVAAALKATRDGYNRVIGHEDVIRKRDIAPPVNRLASTSAKPPTGGEASATRAASTPRRGGSRPASPQSIFPRTSIEHVQASVRV